MRGAKWASSNVVLVALSACLYLPWAPLCRAHYLPDELLKSDIGKISRLFDNISVSLKAHSLEATAVVELPHIVMVGMQSKGKSSTLEQITGLPIFPTGDKMVTRMAMRVQLMHIRDDAALQSFCKEEGLQHDPHGSYIRMRRRNDNGHQPSKKTNHPFQTWTGPVKADHAPSDEILADVLDTARRYMQETANFISTTKSARSVDSEHHLMVEVKGRHQPDLNLVDLPGIVLAPGKEDHNDLPEEIKGIVRKYLREDCLVLVVEEAYNDLMNTASFNLVKEAGKLDYAVGVLTKSNLLKADKQDPFFNRFMGNLKGEANLRHGPAHGFVALSHRDSSRIPPLSMAEAHAAERAWMEHNLPADMSNHHGGPALIKKLVTMMNSFVQSPWGPKAITKIRSALQEVKTKHDLLGTEVPLDAAGKRRLLNEIAKVRLKGIVCDDSATDSKSGNSMSSASRISANLRCGTILRDRYVPLCFTTPKSDYLTLASCWESRRS